MSMPNIPDINPNINLSRDEAITLILVSIAMEEISLSHIINAEAEKIQKAIQVSKTIDDLMRINEGVQEVLKIVVKEEMLLQFKLDEVLKLNDDKKHCDKKCKEKKSEKHCDNYFNDEFSGNIDDDE